MNNQTIILQGTTPEALSALINEGIKSQLEAALKSVNANPDELLTREAACQFLDIEKTTLHHWTVKGKIMAYGLGQKRYYIKSELLGALKPLKVK